MILQWVLTFLLSLVGKHGSESHVTNALDVLYRGVELVIDDNAAFVVFLNTNGLEVEALCVRPTADSDEDNICVELKQPVQ